MKKDDLKMDWDLLGQVGGSEKEGFFNFAAVPVPTPDGSGETWEELTPERKIRVLHEQEEDIKKAVDHLEHRLREIHSKVIVVPTADPLHVYRLLQERLGDKNISVAPWLENKGTPTELYNLLQVIPAGKVVIVGYTPPTSLGSFVHAACFVNKLRDSRPSPGKLILLVKPSFSTSAAMRTSVNADPEELPNTVQMFPDFDKAGKTAIAEYILVNEWDSKGLKWKIPEEWEGLSAEQIRERKGALMEGWNSILQGLPIDQMEDKLSTALAMSSDPRSKELDPKELSKILSRIFLENIEAGGIRGLRVKDKEEAFTWHGLDDPRNMIMGYEYIRSHLGKLAEKLRRSKTFETPEEESKYLREDVALPIYVFHGGPGAAKSVAADAAARVMGDEYSLVSFDPSDVRHGIVGSTEENLGRALRTIQSLRNCVVVIDEIGKQLAPTMAAQSHTGGAETGMLASWMENPQVANDLKKHGVILIGTTNDPEWRALRGGVVSGGLMRRFEPYEFKQPETVEAWRDVIKVIFRGLNLTNLANLDLEPLAERMYHFNNELGVEFPASRLRNMAQNLNGDAHLEGREVTQEDLDEAVRQLHVTSVGEVGLHQAPGVPSPPAPVPPPPPAPRAYTEPEYGRNIEL